MKKLLITLGALALLAVPALAQAPDLREPVKVRVALVFTAEGMWLALPCGAIRLASWAEIDDASFNVRGVKPDTNRGPAINKRKIVPIEPAKLLLYTNLDNAG